MKLASSDGRESSQSRNHRIMNGLDLDLFLRIVQTDFTAWLLVALAIIAILVTVWAGAGTHKALRKCIMLSVVAHVLLMRYGKPVEFARSGLGLASSIAEDPLRDAPPLPPGIRSLEIIDLQNLTDGSLSGDANGSSRKGSGGRGAARGILPNEISDTLPNINTDLNRPARPELPVAEVALNNRVRQEQPELPEPAILNALPTAIPKPEQRPSTELSATSSNAENSVKSDPTIITDQERSRVLGNALSKPAIPRPIAPPLPTPETARRVPREVLAKSVVAPSLTKPATRLPEVKLPTANIAAGITPTLPVRPSLESRPELPVSKQFATASGPIKPVEDLAPPVPFLEPPKAGDSAAGKAAIAAKSVMRNMPTEKDLRSKIRTQPESSKPIEVAAVPARDKSEIELPKPDLSQLAGASLLSDRRGRPANRPLEEIPLVYRTRLDPNRAKLALKAGASGESEKSVEMALEWLRKHQDADGRWDGGVAKYRDGSIATNEDSFTVHCPPGDICFGECFYWEADTALTSLSLLAYLGAGYTHTDGKHADTVSRGLDYLIRIQKPNGDLRGQSVAVGMYCHAMAALAMCEAYALTGDERLKKPASLAIDFLVDSQAEGGAAWRYEPKAPVGDTSILGWVVLALRSGRSMGFSVPDSSIKGIQAWLDGVQSGRSGGLSKYQPWREVTPTMTAEAWVCRWFLNLDTNPKRNLESANYLLEHGPDRDPYNLYYWYYGTLSMFQNGGEGWDKWNGLVRDRIVKRQKTKGHQTGSWDPDDSSYGAYGGRIYSTALATLTLEVYYRFLRLYDQPEAVKPAP